MPEPDTMDTDIIAATLGPDIEVAVDDRLKTLETEVTLVHNSLPCDNLSTVPSSMDGTQPLLVSTSEDKPDSDVALGNPVTTTANTKAAPYKQGPRRSFTTEFKLECVEHAERIKNKTKTARVFNVNRRRVQEWCTQKEKLMAIPKQQKRLSGGGRRQPALDAPMGHDSSKSVLMDAIMSGTVSDPEIFTSSAKTASSSSSSETEAVGGSQIFPVHNVATSDHSIIDSMVRTLSVADSTVLSPNMLKMIQDLSTEVTSHVTRASFESILRDTSMEMLLQKSTDSSNIIPMNVTGEGQEIREMNQTIELTSEVQETPIDINMSLQQDGSTQEPSTVIGSCNSGPNMNTVADPTVDTTLKEQLIQNPPLVQESALDVSVQAAILDALMHVAVATSVQMASTEQQSQLSATPSTVASTELESSALNTANAKGGLVTGSEPPPTPTGNSSAKMKKFYTVDFKLDCVAHAESTSKCAAARQFNVDRRRVQDWCSQKEKLKQIGNRQTNVFAGEKKPMDEDIEKQLVAWIKLQQESRKQLTRKMVADEAVKLYREMGNMTFSANVGWVARFMIRNGISLVPSSLYRPVVSASAASTANDPLDSASSMMSSE